VPTGLLAFFGSTTQTATELGTIVLVTDEAEFGFTKPTPPASIKIK
jgi:hypothetical protein